MCLIENKFNCVWNSMITFVATIRDLLVFCADIRDNAQQNFTVSWDSERPFWIDSWVLKK